MDLPENLTELCEGANDKENDSQNSNSGEEVAKMKVAEVPRKFMVSSLSDADREVFFKFLSNIGVAFSKETHCDSDATHVIAHRLNRQVSKAVNLVKRCLLRF